MKIVYQNISKPYDISEIINSNPIFKEFYLLFKEFEQQNVIEKLSHYEYGILFSNYIEVLSRFLYNPDDYVINCSLLDELIENPTIQATFIYYTYFILLDKFNEDEENVEFYVNHFLGKKTEFKSNKNKILTLESKIWKNFDKKIMPLIVNKNLHQINQFCDEMIKREFSKLTEQFTPKIRSNRMIEKPMQLDRLIFKNDGLKMFNHLVANYPKKKNRAFFSYIFFFMQKKHKLQITSSDNKDYRDYVLLNFPLESYSRIINSNSNKQFKKDDIENHFEQTLESYSDTF